jgi:hypothetical protein
MNLVDLPAIPCPKCQAPVGVTRGADVLTETCPSCRTTIEIHPFLPLFKPPRGVPVSSNESPAHSGAACFFHPRASATASCHRCGRFLCSLCDVEWSDQHLCPECLSKAHARDALEGHEQQRVRYDIITWHLLILPVLFCFYVVPVTAPAAVALAILKRNSPPSRVANSRLSIRLGLTFGIILCLLVIVGILAFFDVFESVSFTTSSAIPFIS